MRLLCFAHKLKKTSLGKKKKKKILLPVRRDFQGLKEPSGLQERRYEFATFTAKHTLLFFFSLTNRRWGKYKRILPA